MNTRELERGFSKVPGEKGKTCEYPLNVARGDSRSVSNRIHCGQGEKIPKHPKQLENIGACDRTAGCLLRMMRMIFT